MSEELELEAEFEAEAMLRVVLRVLGVEEAANSMIISALLFEVSDEDKTSTDII
jgi:hypothetical protein